MLLTEYNEAETMELFKEEGRAEGRQEGRKEESLSVIKNTMANANCSSDRAMELMGIPKEERGKYAEKLRAE